MCPKRDRAASVQEGQGRAGQGRTEQGMAEQDGLHLEMFIQPIDQHTVDEREGLKGSRLEAVAPTLF